MTFNPILDEIHAIREQLLAEHGGDLHAYVEAARKRALASGRPICLPKQRTKDCTEADGRSQSDGNSVSSAR